MSSIGLNTNTFRITGKYLDLLTDFVVRAKVNQKIEDVQKDTLIDFITKIHDQNNAQPQFQLLANIIERELRANKKDYRGYLETMISEIQANKTETFLPKIEFLADILDTENSEALLKIMGE